MLQEQYSLANIGFDTRENEFGQVRYTIRAREPEVRAPLLLAQVPDARQRRPGEEARGLPAAHRRPLRDLPLSRARRFPRRQPLSLGAIPVRAVPVPVYRYTNNDTPIFTVSDDIPVYRTQTLEGLFRLYRLRFCN